jgi:hypothetical protein
MSNRVKSEIVSLSGFERASRIDLGLEIARWHARPGEPMTREILAEFCGCTDTMIFLIEQKAMRKLRRLLDVEGRGKILRDLMLGLFERREPAQPKTQQ